LSNLGRGTNVDSPRWLCHHQYAGVLEDFASDDKFLQIPPGQSPRHSASTRAADVKLLDAPRGECFDRACGNEAKLDHAVAMRGEQGVVS
jgi:hypothetical protein